MARTPSIGRTAVRRDSKAAAPARAVRKPGARPAKASEASPYHHGDLHDALLKAAETVLERDGLGGLTLRAVAREAGVSHAAPTHHFGDLTGLVSELAAIGFRQFNVAMAAAGAIDAPPLMKAMARAKAYVAYAQARPGMYGLMFRTERLDMKRPSLHEAASASFAGLAGAIGTSRQEQISDERAVAGAGRRHRARLVAGSWIYHVAAGRPVERHPAAAAQGQQRRDPAGRHAALDRRPAAGGVIQLAQTASSVHPSSAELRCAQGRLSRGEKFIKLRWADFGGAQHPVRLTAMMDLMLKQMKQ